MLKCFDKVLSKYDPWNRNAIARPREEQPGPAEPKRQRLKEKIIEWKKRLWQGAGQPTEEERTVSEDICECDDQDQRVEPENIADESGVGDSGDVDAAQREGRVDPAVNANKGPAE